MNEIGARYPYNFYANYTSEARVIRSSHERQSLTMGAQYYHTRKYDYEYTPRTVDARGFFGYRRELSLEKELSRMQASALTKLQSDKAGGLFNISIPIKSKAVESLFGEGGAGLKVSGYHRITFSGRSQWIDNQASTATSKQSKFPSLNMEQISRFDISGTIGTKISVSVTHDSKTDIPLANRLMLRYKGDEDDILKTIEAGNTTLSLPNTKFVGYSQRIQGLFGLKTEAQVGPLTLTAIASQEKGNSERTSFEAGSSASKSYIRDYRYNDGRIYDLGRVDTAFYDPDSLDFYAGDSILYIEVYKRSGSTIEAEEAAPDAELYVDPDHPELYTAEASPTTVVQVDPEQYLINPAEFWILFNTANAGSYNELGVYLIIKRGAYASGRIDTVGNISSTPYQLKLLKHSTPDKSYVTWNYLWRNVYYLDANNIDLKGLEINVYKGSTDNAQLLSENLDHQGGVQYIQILGLDRYDQSGGATSDGLVDIETPIVDPVRGLLIFPEREPFNTDKTYADVALAVKVPQIYEFSYNNVEVLENTTYYIEVSNLSRRAEISLNKPNIIEGSERITLNGQELVRGQDYNINYDFGQVTFLTDDALDPNADLNIDFEYSPFISNQKKTLFGVRGEYEPSSNLKIGTTFLYKSDKATERKPKVGQETARTIVWDGDISFKVRPNFLTSMVDALPFISTEAESNLQFSGELARSFPNPNVDGVAYIDDFEGSRDSYSLGIFRETWSLSSKPVGLDETWARGDLVWYNPYTQVATDQIWNRQLRPGESGTHTLWLEYTPKDSTLMVVDTIDVDDFDTSYVQMDSWAGIMRAMTAGAINQDRAQLLELRLKGDHGIIHIEMGKISEDIDGNGELDTEDKKNVSGYSNGIVDADEDTGLDGLFDEEEPGYDPTTNPDPSGDNWYYNGFGKGCNGCSQNDYSHINGTEGNTEDPNRLGKPDSEDINLNRSLDKLNSYFSYKIDLSNNDFLVDSSEYNNWRTFRIPIRDTLAMDTALENSLWTQINYIRLWLESDDGQPFIVAIAAADLIQSIWADTLIKATEINPSQFSVAVINNQENTDYQSPPGVEGYFDKTSDVREPEQSLLLHYENLVPGDTCVASRILFDTPSYIGYRTLKMFVHGPPDVDSILFFFRLGERESDYYEYRTVLRPGWDLENEVEIDFNDITFLKEQLLTAKADNPDTNQIVDGNYRVRGNPTITRIKYLACGLINMSQDTTFSRPSGDIWVDELRLTDVRADNGTAARASVGGNVADLFSYTGSYEYKDSYFRGISQSTRGGSGDNLGSGKTTTSYGVSFSFRGGKLFPRSWGVKIPVSIRYSKSTDVPRLRFNTDIVLPEELQDAESSISESRGFTVSESFNKKTRNPLFTLLLNKFNGKFSYSVSEGRSPKVPESFSESYHASGTYNLKVTPPHISPFFWTAPIPLVNKLSGSRFYLIPNSLDMRGNFDRSLSISRNSSGVLNKTLRRTMDGNMKVGYKVSDNMAANYSMTTRRDLNNLDELIIVLDPKKFKLGRETSFSQSFGVTYGPKIFDFLTHSVVFTTSYRENLNVRDSTRNAGASKSYGIDGNLDLKKLFGTGQKKRTRSSPVKRTNVIRRGKDKDEDGDENKDEEKDKGPSGSILDPLTGVMRFLTGWINPIGYDFNESYSYSYSGLGERAHWKFRFGISDDIGVSSGKSSSGFSTQSTSVSKSTSYAFRSGTTFFGGLKTDVSYSRKISRDIVKVSNPRKSITTNFPDIKFTIRPLSSLTFLNPLIKRFSPRTGYSRSTGEGYNLQTGYKVSERKSVTYRPLLSLTVNVVTGMQISISTDKAVTEDKVFNSQTGEPTNRKRTTSKNYSFSTRYSFTAPGGIRIPLLGRMKFRSTMSLQLDISMRKQKTESASEDNPLSSTGEKSDLVISPVISYSFSQQIKGGITGKWQTSNDIGLKRKTNVRELRIWVEIRF